MVEDTKWLYRIVKVEEQKFVRLGEGVVSKELEPIEKGLNEFIEAGWELVPFAVPFGTAGAGLLFRRQRQEQ